MNLLFITPSVPYPPHTGGQLRSWHLLRYLATKGKVTLISIGRPGQYETVMPELKRYCANVFLADPKKFESAKEVTGLTSVRVRLQKLLRLQPWLLDHFVDPEILKQIKLAKPEEQDLIVIRFAGMSYYFLNEKEYRGLFGKMLVDIDDVSTIVRERALKQMGPGYRKMWSTCDLILLKHYYRKFRNTAVCFVSSVRDADYLVKNRMAHKTFVIPNVFEVNGRKLTSPQNVRDPEILFCGMLSYPPNQDAVSFFADAVFPRIREEIPNAHFTIVGMHAPEKMVRLWKRPGITVAGYVPSMEPYYEKAALAAVPLLNGGGTRIKILEAMAYERPVVSTSVGAEGLEVTEGENILIADHPELFARKCIALIRNPEMRRQIAANAYQLVKEKYDVGVFHKSMDDVFEYVATGKEKEDQTA